MSTGAIIGIVVAVVVVVALVAVALRAKARSNHLRSRFGDEYDRTVHASSKRDAERELLDRERRHAEYDIRPLSPAEREDYTARWSLVQAKFVDQPGAAVEEADRLVTALMADRGYPVDGDDDTRVADLSVRHSSTVEHYRVAQSVRAKHTGDGDASTEELREAIVRYRSLFDELLADGTDTAESSEVDGQVGRAHIAHPRDGATRDAAVRPATPPSAR
ncbi:hypothetical protein [Actinokineospora globicatena]|uniref:hypothetical protein n=1 Tax=Actinokineospora globicatena TaxID=103729 RepID=UPI0024A32407|nr:hypothetical protein [Actinokineospora globicatena]MCP2305069.1 hypothetical protein [Actinokineospora globicatena]GLW80534.1 hypothetical protein Aglo01_50150 [Actinokineospora globicatena]GLW87362.1 hypothetical protein Aglo02_50010 [Actinokineospora globicatena]